MTQRKFKHKKTGHTIFNGLGDGILRSPHMIQNWTIEEAEKDYELEEIIEPMNNEPTPTTLSEELKFELQKQAEDYAEGTETFNYDECVEDFKAGAMSPIAKRIHREGYISIEESEKQMSGLLEWLLINGYTKRTNGKSIWWGKEGSEEDFTYEELLTQFKQTNGGQND